jgi:hypothetical protein
MLTEINQTQKDKYHIFAHMWNPNIKATIRQDCKRGTNWKETSGRERGKGEYGGWW